MQMVGNSLKNFFKCLVYIFVPLGCIFLGFLFGVQLFLNELVTQADYIAVQLSELVDGTEAQVDNLIGFVIASLRELDWSEPLGTLTFLMDGDWIAARIAEFLQLTVEEAAALEEQVVSIAANVAMALLADLVALVLCVAASVVIGYFVTNYFVRKSTVRRGFWGFWIASIADAVLTVTLIAFVTWLMTVSTAGAVLSGIAGALVFGFVALFEAYLLHGHGKIRFRKVVNLGNCVWVWVSQISVLAAATAVSALFMWLTTSFVAVALVLSVIIIALLVINVNAESYVDGLVRKLPAGDKRVKTYAQLESVPAYLRQDSALDETIIDRANDQGGK